MDYSEAAKYQNRSIASIETHLSQGLDVVLSAPMSAGKTHITIGFLRTEARAGRRAAVIQHREGLLRQSAAKAEKNGLKVSLAKDGEIDASGDVVYGLIQTVAGKADQLGPISVLVIDEAHHATADQSSQYAQFIADITKLNPDLRIVASSATLEPERGLHPRLARATPIEVTWSEAQAAGMIVPIRTEQRRRLVADGGSLQDLARQLVDPRQPAKSAIGLNAAFKRLRTDGDMEILAQDFLARPESRRGQTLFFVDEIKDAQRLETALKERGYEAASLHSNLSAAEKDRHERAYAEGRLTGLIAVDMIGEGFDAPATKTLVSAKVTTSSIEFVQMVGRLTRAHTGKTEGVFVDYGASTLIHGRIETFAAIQTYLAPKEARPRANDNTPKFSPWTKIDRNLYGIDFGENTLIARKLDEKTFHTVRLSPDKSGSKTQIVNLGKLGSSELAKLAKRELRAHRRTVVSLLSDLDPAGRSLMSLRLAATHKKHEASINLITAPQATLGTTPLRQQAVAGKAR